MNPSPAWNYLRMIAALYGIAEEQADSRIREFIQFFDLDWATLTDKLLGAYSKGMRRKVVIISALLHNPPVIFFDEPLDGLDANAAVDSSPHSKARPAGPHRRL